MQLRLGKIWPLWASAVTSIPNQLPKIRQDCRFSEIVPITASHENEQHSNMNNMKSVVKEWGVFQPFEFAVDPNLRDRDPHHSRGDISET